MPGNSRSMSYKHQKNKNHKLSSKETSPNSTFKSKTGIQTRGYKYKMHTKYVQYLISLKAISHYSRKNKIKSPAQSSCTI